MNQVLGSSTQNDSANSASDEISVTDLFRNLWRQRGLIMAVLLFSVAVVIALHFFRGSIAAPLKVDYPVSIPFTNGESRYPNGSPFSPNDLTALVVLERAIAKNEIDVTVSRLAKSLSVTYSNSLLLKAEEELGETLQRVNTPSDIKEAASVALLQLKSDSQRFLTISLMLDEAGLAPEQGVLLVKAIVEEWAHITIDQGLLNADIPRPVNSFIIHTGGNLIDVYDSAKDYLLSLSAAIEGLSKQAGADSLIVSGKSLSDLRREIKALEGTDVGPLREFAYSNSSSLASVDPAIQVRLFARQRLLKLEQERLTKLIASYDSAVAQLTAVEAGKGQSVASPSNLQLEQSVIDTLLQMGTKLGAVENRNKLFDRRTKAVEDLLALEKEMAILMGVADSAYGALNPAEILNGALPGIERRLNGIQKDVDAFFIIYRDINLQSDAQLYSAQSAPQIRGGALIVAKQLIKFSVLAAVLGLMLGVMVALIRAAMINSNRN